MDQTNYLKNKISNRLKYYRKLYCITLKELSEKTGVRKAFLKKIEDGTAARISLLKIEKISNALGLELLEFFRDIEN